MIVPVMPSVPRGKRKKPSEIVATQPLSKRTNMVSAALLAVVPGLNRGNSSCDTEHDSGNGNQHFLPAHRNLHAYASLLDPAAVLLLLASIRA